MTESSVFQVWRTCPHVDTRERAITAGTLLHRVRTQRFSFLLNMQKELPLKRGGDFQSKLQPLTRSSRPATSLPVPWIYEYICCCYIYIYIYHRLPTLYLCT